MHRLIETPSYRQIDFTEHPPDPNWKDFSVLYPQLKNTNENLQKRGNTANKENNTAKKKEKRRKHGNGDMKDRTSKAVDMPTCSADILSSNNTMLKAHQGNSFLKTKTNLANSKKRYGEDRNNPKSRVVVIPKIISGKQEKLTAIHGSTCLNAKKNIAYTVKDDGNIRDLKGRVHLKRVSNSSSLLQCDICLYSTDVKCNFKRHMKLVHEKRKDFKCEECEKLFSSNDAVKRHVQGVHKREKHFMCEYCQDMFSQKINLMFHITVKHKTSEKVKCKECDFMCSRPGNMKKHISRWHTELQSFE